MRNFFVAALCVYSFQAMAVSVNPNLPIGVSVDSAVLASYWQSTVLQDQDRPDGMSSPTGMIHLGTNTDLFSVGASQYWVRYTLGPASSIQYGWGGSDSLSGEFWLSFNKVSGGYQYAWYFDQVESYGQKRFLNPSYSGQLTEGSQTSCGGYYGYCSFSGPTQTQSLEGAALFNESSESTGASSTQTSFLELVWSPAAHRYDLKTTSQGFDQVFFEFSQINEMVSYDAISLSIVPVPSSAVLLLSGLTGLVGARRFRKSVI